MLDTHDDSARGNLPRRNLRHSWCALIVLSGWTLQAGAVEVETELSLGLGYRTADLNWDIAGNLVGTGPNVLSELKWNDMQLGEATAAGELRIDKRLVLRGRGAYGWILSGNNQDSDYDGNNRTLEFSRSNSEAGGRVGEATFGLGYEFWWYDSSVGRYARVIPQFGYAWRRQYLDIHNGRQVIPASAASPIDDLDSSYDTEWQGPWLGLTLDMDASDRTRVSLEFEYHFADYHAEANWNLRTDWAHPVSFVHDTTATGVVAALAFRQELGRHWLLSARIESQHFKGEPGVDTINLINSTTGAIDQVATRLNTVEWQSLAANLALTLRF